jgi:dihydrofolate reductase
VLTHRPPDDAANESVTFLSTPLQDAVTTALEAASGRNVVIFGANLAGQCLQAGLLNEAVTDLAPVLLGDGVRLYDSIGTDPIMLIRNALATTGQLTDLRFRVQ